MVSAGRLNNLKARETGKKKSVVEITFCTESCAFVLKC